MVYPSSMRLKSLVKLKPSRVAALRQLDGMLRLTVVAEP
jgi:hypothetical protein